MKKEKENTKLGKGRRAEEQKSRRKSKHLAAKSTTPQSRAPVQLATAVNVVPS